MNRLFLLAIMLLCIKGLYAQDTTDRIFDFAEVEPQFKGGEKGMIKFIQKEVNYPEEAREKGEQGTVYIQFVVEKDGSLSNIVVLKGASQLLDEEAVRVVSKMPKWKPGKQKGKVVRVRYQIPIRFSIA
ncbi:MAG: energy transducer TonB [Bacteroidetes bacterium]|nr:energy transducer TonB [Bacteroidota bacterium]